MSEIEKRIATVWPGRPTTADVEATRIADLRAVLEVTNALADRIEVQADITGQIGASFHALAARVAALESAPRIVTAGSQDDDRVSPAPPAPLVERMWRAYSSCESTSCLESMAAALLVAAEELLGPVTTAEREEFGFGNIATINRVDHVLRARLAAALEACR